LHNSLGLALGVQAAAPTTRGTYQMDVTPETILLTAWTAAELARDIRRGYMASTLHNELP
jgi:hypothetical protein